MCQTKSGTVLYGKVRADGQLTCIETTARNGSYKRDIARRFVTAWTMLSRAWSFQPPDEAALREQFKSAQPLTADQQEALRRTQIQVEVAIRENRLVDAARLYQAALTATPAWPGGQFNDALLLADMEFYPSAIAHMRVYLVLAPDAPDARAARDKIYEWEARLPRVGP
jgi:predicted Zn-dependent protease